MINGEITKLDITLNEMRLIRESRSDVQIAQDDQFEYAMRAACRSLSCPSYSDGKCLKDEVLCFTALHFKKH